MKHTFLGTNSISCTIAILTVQQILLKWSISSKGHHQFLMDFIWIRTYDALRAKSMFLIKSAIQYNNSTTNSVVALYGAQHLHVKTPSQYGYLHRCWSGGEQFATLCKIWPAYDSNSRPQAIAVDTVSNFQCQLSILVYSNKRIWQLEVYYLDSPKENKFSNMT